MSLVISPRIPRSPAPHPGPGKPLRDLLAVHHQVHVVVGAEICNGQQVQGAVEAFIKGDEVQHMVGGIVEKVVVEKHVFVIQKNSQWIDVGFH